MRWFKRISVVCLLLASAAAGTAAAASVTVTVADASGVLVDAVVSLEPARPVAPSAGKTVEMDQINSQFVLAVRTGTLVRFANNDQIRHQVYSFSPVKRFELPLFQGTTAAPVRFDQPGLVTIGCNIHDSMQGYIVVLETPYFGKTGSDGRAQLEAPAGNYTLRVWHPRIKGAASSEP
ncbi:methylamine utilization protein, partial [Xanthomonas oryzae]